MNALKTTMTSLALTCLALFPALATANDLDELDVTMEVLDSVAELDGQVLVMPGPEVDGVSDRESDRVSDRVTDRVTDRVRDRELLVLKYVEGWSYRRIAEHRGSTERAIESRVHRARGRLRAVLTQLRVVDADQKETVENE